MPRTFEAHQFAKTADHQYVCVTWFERDRQTVRLETPRGRAIFDLWDEDATDAIERLPHGAASPPSPTRERGPVPAGEPCAQAGTGNYLARSMRECEVFRRLLERVFPIPDGLPVKHVVRSHPHDFGACREVSVR